MRDFQQQILGTLVSILGVKGSRTLDAHLGCVVNGSTLFGVGIDSSIVTASLKAVVSAVNRALR
jgi:2-isopropylmalate synthase